MALMMCYIPANLIALSSVPQDKLKNAAGLYNLTRDLGGATNGRRSKDRAIAPAAADDHVRTLVEELDVGVDAGQFAA